MPDEPIDRLFIASFVSRAAKRFSIDEIESGLVSRYLSRAHKSTKNRFLKSIVSKANGEKFSSFAESSGFTYSFNSVLTAFEFLVESGIKGSDGVVYTPELIVNYILDNTIDRAGTVLDPSCGAGAFLIGAMRRIREISGLGLKEIAEKYVHGKDLSELAARHSRISVILYMLEQGEDYEEVSLNIETEDSLGLLGVLDEKDPKNKFDFVVGNPPYVRFQDLDASRRATLEARSSVIEGFNFNLYFAFIELGFHALNERGKLGYIVPNNFFTTFAAKRLRRFLLEGRKVSRIVNFTHIRVFQGSSTYTSILNLDRSNKDDFIEYSSVRSYTELENLERLHFTKVTIEEGEDGRWRILEPEDMENIRKIESAGKPLGEKFRISVGIASLKDEVYLVKGTLNSQCLKEYRGSEYPIERDITRRIVKIASVKNEEELDKWNMRIIFPYERDTEGKFSLIAEEKMRTSYPLCFSYLSERRKELEHRDKGKGVFPAWYAYGRTQGFNSYGTRLYTKTFSNGPNFIFDEGDSLFCNGYAIFVDENALVYQKILNSSIMDYYMRRTSTEINGNYQCYQKNYIERFGLPELGSDEISFLKSVQDPGLINEFLAKKYGVELPHYDLKTGVTNK